MIKTYLNVQYAEKDTVRSLGARWDVTKKRWYITENSEPFLFAKWLPKEKQEELKKEYSETKKGVTLSTVLVQVQQAVKEKFGSAIWLRTEIASINHHSSGHRYLELVETDKQGKEICKNRAIIWASDAEFLLSKFEKETGSKLNGGIKVLLRVDIDYNIKFGLNIKVTDIDPTYTLGGMESKINEIRTSLKKQNIFDKNKQLLGPKDFTNIAVISPADAAGLGDFKIEADKLKKNGLCTFSYFTASFQGVKVNKSIFSAFEDIRNEIKKYEYDAIVIIRGGGSKTDLHFLNEYDIVKAICETKIPVFVGVGHERDKVLIDEVANKSFDTPSKVIAYIQTMIVRNAKFAMENLKFINTSSKRQVQLLNFKIDSLERNVRTSSNERVLKLRYLVDNNFYSIKNGASSIVNGKIRIIENNFNTIKRGIFHEIHNVKNKTINHYHKIVNISKQQVLFKIKDVELNIKSIEPYNPKNILNRGYSLIKKQGVVVKNISELIANDDIEITLQDGSMSIKIQEVKDVSKNK
jgi:exodeoxyribonuclease VII large subunit